MENKLVRRVVIIKLHDDVSEQTKKDILQKLMALGESPDVRNWLVKESLDTRKGQIIIEEGIFESEAAIERFRLSPEHQTVGKYMSQLADWWTAVFYE